MSKRLAIFGIIGGLLLPSFFALFLAVKPVYADAYKPGRRDSLDKALLAGLAKCYGGDMMEQSLNLSEFDRINNLSNDRADDDEDFVLLPSGETRIDDQGVSCAQLLQGYGDGANSMASIFVYFGKTVPTAGSVEEKEVFLNSMGYAKIAGASGRQCMALTYSAVDFGLSNPYERNVALRLCGEVDGSGVVTSLDEKSVAIAADTFPLLLKQSL